MRLQLKEGWTERPEKRFGKVGGNVLNDFVTRSYDGSFVAWPNGGPDSAEVFPTIEEAHVYLLSVGSESPFRDLDELTAAAEGEGPVAPEPSLAEQIAQAQEVWAASAEHMRKRIDEWWAGLTPSVIMPPTPRLCALDRLIAAGFVTRLCDEWVALYSPDLRGIMVSIKPTRLAGCFRAKLFDTTGDESPGLNAALESLLSKPVGAVTVAQILGVA